MSAETLRKAASLMRARAQAATPGPWFTYDGEPWAGDQQVALDYDADRISDVEYNDAANPPLSLFHGDVVRKPDGTHIASWDPVVALAVARVFIDAAHYIEWSEANGYVAHTPLIESLTEAARAYLGGAS